MNSILVRAIRFILKYFSIISYNLVEPRFIDYTQYKYHPIFIIGAPRCGSTILYQLLTNYLDINYPDNLVNLARENIFLGMKLCKLFFNNKPHDNFNSNYGSTLQFGLHSPSELGVFWDKWLPKNQHFVNENDYNKNTVKELRYIFYKIIDQYQKPFLYKNLAMGQRLRLIKSFAPNSKIIHIKRNPIFNSQSIYKKLKKTNSKWWSIKPKNWVELKKLDKIEISVKQLYYLEKQIHNDLNLFKRSQIFELNYNELKDTPAIIENIRNFLDMNISYRKAYKRDNIEIRNTQKISDSEFTKLKSIIKNTWG